ncbi:Protein of unknown function [Azospirillum oryzae]|uniref:Antitoxin Xre/MbcA/ParS-like toxin-binding domain-containing protein n=1 Tax=Azospirillum oryzae TaxID=286727 RepID=A0A1X7DW32_9PROT|nr:MbcA/ParS/Xre antitoxin family protein [Azospirillum oryzae]SMF22598.1 Protein of unknown function [Azospirillum oryzae]
MVATARQQAGTADDTVARGMAGVFTILKAWGASNEQARRILGSPAERTFYAWKAGRVGAVPHDTVRRLGYVLGIYKSLQILYANPQQADGWPARPNRAFGGQAPLERMAGGDVTDLAAVHQYLDAYRGAWS